MKYSTIIFFCCLPFVLGSIKEQNEQYRSRSELENNIREAMNSGILGDVASKAEFIADAIELASHKHEEFMIDHANRMYNSAIEHAKRHGTDVNRAKEAIQLEIDDMFLHPFP